MSSPSVDLRNSFLAVIYLIFGCIASIILAFVILIHLKYATFRQKMYSIIFACLFCEIIIPFHYFLNAMRRLINGTLQDIDALCIFDASILDFACATLLFYNIFTMLLLFFNKLPSSIEIQTKTKENRINDYYNSNWSKHAFTYLHLISIGFGISHSLLFYFSKSYGITNFGDCFMKQEYSPYFITLGIPLFLYLFTSIAYIFINRKKKFYRKFPTLKKFSVYVSFTSICWCSNFLRYFIQSEHLSGYNSLTLTLEFIAIIVIIYIRISNGYIQTILKQGDSSNKLIQAFLIFFCIDDGYADLEQYERRTTIKLNALTGEFNINE